MLSTTVGRFRVVSIAEGCSFLILLVFGSVLSRISDINLVMPLGVLHAVMFILLLLATLDVRTKLSWDTKTTLLAVVAAILPLGPFVFDYKMKHKLVEPTAAPAAA
ncbi:DUF3817 domain-containing protein [Streptomyces sp. SID3343]|uniref:DUF3817 domain-containing protein n=1 Tax=Streptomyces sp. SID3343 TaxID=2690260 RepID=UPI001371228A|nr:DUF3817 domain-containing protein [Streptomyces sp. SID3343]MYV96911.1 DUF3817 domain-containing protein [Streptomyces sp. SID3343]